MDFDQLMAHVEQEMQGKTYGYVSDIYLLPERPPFFYVCKRWVVPGPRFLANLEGFRVTKEFIRSVLNTCYERNTEKSENTISSTKHEMALTDFAFDWEMKEAPSMESPLQQKKRTWRVRAHVSYNNLGQSLTLRLLSRDVPNIEDLHLPSHVKNMVYNPSGLVLVCGPTGGGKSTTMASLVKAYAAARFGHISTLEDPIEYVFDFKDRLVTQQIVGRHVESWSKGIHHALRDKVELLVIGEMRDSESVRAAIQAAGAGHLVIASTHYTSATRVLNSLVNLFPPHEVEVMKQSLMNCLIGVVCQNLLPGSIRGVHSVIPCYEIMFNTAEIRANLMQNSFNVLDGLLGTAKYREQGIVKWQARLDEMLATGQISKEVHGYFSDDSVSAPV